MSELPRSSLRPVDQYADGVETPSPLGVSEKALDRTSAPVEIPFADAPFEPLQARLHTNCPSDLDRTIEIPPSLVGALRRQQEAASHQVCLGPTFSFERAVQSRVHTPKGSGLVTSFFSRRREVDEDLRLEGRIVRPFARFLECSSCLAEVAEP